MKFILHYYKLYIENRVKTLVIWSFYKSVDIKNLPIKKAVCSVKFENFRSTNFEVSIKFKTLIPRRI